jgi:ubiquinol-cytochrome c reductase cytochrome c subunit
MSRLLLWLPPALAIVAGAVSLAAPGAHHTAAQSDELALGAALYAAQCASCHGDDGLGVRDRGPSLVDEGEAAADFVLRTGRMPLADPAMQARRKPVPYTEEEIVALVRYVGTFGDGPPIPQVEPGRGDLTVGGELYRLNCAACHVTSGSGAAIGGGRDAPPLRESTPTEIAEAIIVGPGAMPSFDTFTTENFDDVAAYVADLQEQRTTSIDSFGGVGPVAEGLAAWILGLIPVIAFTRWIGSAHEGRDTHAESAEADP